MFKNIVFSIVSILIVKGIFVNSAHAVVDPANYNFSLDQLAVFKPGSDIKGAIEKYGKAELIDKNSKTKTLRFYVAHIRYKFAVIVRIAEEKVVDFHARLPAYFLHDVFHQSMLNRYGKQNFYRLINGTAVYLWENKEGVNYLYNGTCTITCFPVYLSAYPKEPPFKGYKPLYEEFVTERDFKKK
jgi:hypothetical protein